MALIIVCWKEENHDDGPFPTNQRSMEIIRTKIDGVVIIEPSIFEDESKAILSDKDTKHAHLKDFTSPF